MDYLKLGYNYITSAYRTEKEVRNYLSKKGCKEYEISEIIGILSEDGYLNDDNYAKLYFEHGFEKGWGKEKILYELSKKGINREMAEYAYEDYLYENDLSADDEEYKRAMEVAVKVANLSDYEYGKPLSDKLKNKIVRRILSYGYSFSVAYKCIDRIKNGELDEI